MSHSWSKPYFICYLTQKVVYNAWDKENTSVQNMVAWPNVACITVSSNPNIKELLWKVSSANKCGSALLCFFHDCYYTLLFWLLASCKTYFFCQYGVTWLLHFIWQIFFSRKRNLRHCFIYVFVRSLFAAIVAGSCLHKQMKKLINYHICKSILPTCYHFWQILLMERVMIPWLVFDFFWFAIRFCLSKSR